MGISESSINDDNNDTTNQLHTKQNININNYNKIKKMHNSEKLINEMIKQYLEFHGMQHTLSVFLSESNMLSKNETNNNNNNNNNINTIQLIHNPMPREILTKRLGIIDNNNSTKVLSKLNIYYYLLFAYNIILYYLSNVIICNYIFV